MMVNNSGNNTSNQESLQVREDDININNRKIVLNFGEKGDELDSNEPMA